MSLPERTPKEIRDDLTPSAVPIRGNIAHLSQSNNESIGVLNEDISRLQSAVNDYNVSLTYGIGDFVLESGIVYRNTTAITVPETFDPAKWTAVPSELDNITINEFLDFLTNGASTPINPPAATTGRLFVRTVDANNESLVLIIKKNGSFDEVILG